MTRIRGLKQVRIDQDLYDELIKLAKKKRISITWLVNDILRTSLNID